jgi:putative PIN family toxin of toxin-antitoxin system
VRLVLDTSVVVSAVRSEKGAARQLLLWALDQRFEIALSEPLFLEYESVLKRPEHLAKAQLSTNDMDDLLEQLSEVGVKVHLGPFRRPTLRDAGDEHVIHLAWRARVDALVTNNLRDFYPAAESLGVHCCSPGDALRLLEIEYGSDTTT